MIGQGAFGAIALAQKGADALLKAALAMNDPRQDPAVLSIPVAATDDQPAAAVHLFPIRGEAFYTLGGARWFVVVTCVGPRSTRLDQVMIRALFDLTPAEARLTEALSRNIRLSDYGAAAGLSPNTVKTHLKRIFEKTGVNRQVDLVNLLAGLAIS